MKRSIRKLSVICFLGLLATGHAFGQSAQPDTSQHALNNVISNFYQNIGQQSRLYEGSEYISYDPHIKGNALYPADAQTWTIGEVTYDGFLYKNVPLKYDIYKDIVVALLYNHFSEYVLLSERVSNFSFSNHRFVRVNADGLTNDKSGITTGFYDQLYGTDRVQVLAKRSKTIQNSTSQTVILETYFIEKDDYYVRKGNTYYKVGGQGAFLNVFKDKKPELQKYMKENGFKYRTDPELAMARLAAYYDQITK